MTSIRMVSVAIAIFVSLEVEVINQNTMSIADDTFAAVLARSTNAQTAKEAADVYRAVFSNATLEELSRLKTHSHPNLALRAEWKMTVESIQKMPSPNKAARTKERLARFVGFIEGRTKASADQRWVELVIAGKVNESGNVFCPPSNHNKLAKTSRWGEVFVTGAATLQLKVQGLCVEIC